MTQYYIKIQLKLRQWRERQPRVSHCFKGWSFKNEWDTSLVLYKGCTRVRDKSMHRNTVSSWACWPEFDPWDLHSEGKALTPGKCPLISTHVPWCVHRHLHVHTHMHTQTHINSWMLKKVSKDQNLGAREKVAPWWKHLLSKCGDQSSHHHNSPSIISALRRWIGHGC